jgi:2-hydroxy-3-keto-5-methylthiopentenyl-1-phosphate phosphatase
VKTPENKSDAQATFREILAQKISLRDTLNAKMGQFQGEILEWMKMALASANEQIDIVNKALERLSVPGKVVPSSVQFVIGATPEFRQVVNNCVNAASTPEAKDEAQVLLKNILDKRLRDRDMVRGHMEIADSDTREFFELLLKAVDEHVDIVTNAIARLE